jgi:hypothetical protein
MRKAKLLAPAAIAFMAVSGCTTTSLFRPFLPLMASQNPHCTADPACRVKIVITIPDGGVGCQLSNPYVITVDKGNAPVIEWELLDATGVGYQFARDGIQFTTKDRYQILPPEGVFKILGPGPANVFRVKDNNTAAGLFNYRMKVVKPDGSPGCELDPPIYNGP